MAKNNTEKGGKQTLKVLLDMDEVLCDCDVHFLEEFRKQFPDKPYVPLDKREGFWMLDQYKELGLGKECVDVYSAKGFFANIPEIPGAVVAAKELMAMEGVDVFVCTSGVMNYNYCLREKYQWIEQHLGNEWLTRMILIRDKTMAYGHVLIDDRVDISGVNPCPTWEQVVFSTHHNQHVDLTGRQVLHNWTDGTWRNIIYEFMRKYIHVPSVDSTCSEDDPGTIRCTIV